MYVMNGIAYAGTRTTDVRVAKVTALDDWMLLLTFASGERRIYDATTLLQYPAFQAPRNEEVFKAAQTEYGVVTWADGAIDIAPETMYRDRFTYDEMLM